MLAGRLRSAELIVYPGVGHTPRWEDPARFAADVTAFVQRVHSMCSGGPHPECVLYVAPTESHNAIRRSVAPGPRHAVVWRR